MSRFKQSLYTIHRLEQEINQGWRSYLFFPSHFIKQSFHHMGEIRYCSKTKGPSASFN
ncbi:MAG: hypothetical protein OFPI_30510 [Osedax symbiont Rs2]|nr:MAG: hypothetical protein OFPI_30510 [Osedax symbiont Rs2]